MAANGSIPEIKIKWNTLYIPASLRLTRKQIKAIAKLVQYIQGGEMPEIVIEEQR